MALLLLAPARALLAAVLASLTSGVLMAFLDVRIVGSAGARVGLGNDATVLGDPAFRRAAHLSLARVAANAGLRTALGPAAALMLHQRCPGVRVART